MLNLALIARAGLANSSGYHWATQLSDMVQSEPALSHHHGKGAFLSKVNFRMVFDVALPLALSCSTSG